MSFAARLFHGGFVVLIHLFLHILFVPTTIQQQQQHRTQIDIQCQKGGLESITITDNGTGISPTSLPLACTRFATSKLVTVDDLKSIRTFGFRGEALASASMVGRVCIISRLRSRGTPRQLKQGDGESSDEEETLQNNNCAFKMHYRDGNPTSDPKLPANENSTATIKPKPSAGKEGTTITVQDLFYNIPSRRRAMEGRRSERDEYDRILNCVQRYAVHEAKRGVGFVCRGGGGGGGGKGAAGRASGNHTDLNTQSLASVKRLQERRKKSRIGTMLKQEGVIVSEEEQFAATKDVIGHIFGTAVSRELLPLNAGEGDVEAVSFAALKAMLQKSGVETDSSSVVCGEANDNEHSEANGGGDTTTAPTDSKENFTNTLLEEMMMGDTIESSAPSNYSQSHTDASNSTTTPSQSSKFAFAYKATGLITNGSYSAPKSSAAFLLFINDRLVESASLRRAVESIYSDALPKGGKPFVYLSLELPGPHVDVNVHPTKREVAFLHEDRLCVALAAAVKEVIGSATSSRTFAVAASGALLAPEEKRVRVQPKKAIAMEEREGLVVSTASNVTTEIGESDSGAVDDAMAVDEPEPQQIVDNTNQQQDQQQNEQPKKRHADESKQPPLSKKPYDPSRLVRTNSAAPAGALEPFLVVKKGVSPKNKKALSQSSTYENIDADSSIQHEPGCPLANGPCQVDMAMPGAFASAICRCQVQNSDSLPPAPNAIVVRINANNNIVRPKKISPTECDYESIAKLRGDIVSRNHQNLNETLRGASFVGAVSRSRSLIQYGIDLLMINHRELARETFYQIALMKFNGMPIATLGGGGVDVMEVIRQMLQLEEDLATKSDATHESLRVKVNKTNATLAKQATSCLSEKADMLEEYFSIKFERRGKSLFVTGLPVLLEGHSPQPHALPLFLMRLATEVNWMDERLCFQNVCTELGSYYSEPPVANDEEENAATEAPDYIDDEAKAFVKHTLFPAISFLLVPPKEFATNGTVLKLANLTSLYKVFERC